MPTNSSNRPEQREVIQIGSPDGPQIEFEISDNAVHFARSSKGQFRLVMLSQIVGRLKSQKRS